MAKPMMVMDMYDYENVKTHLSNALIDLCNISENSYFTEEARRHIREALVILQKG